MSDTRFVEIHRARNAIDAHLLKAELEAAGIPVQITDESVAALQMPTPWWAAPRILVAEADSAKAAAIIRELETQYQSRSTSGKTS